jgi:hypothetical protein
MIILDDVLKKAIVEGAHKEACNDYIDSISNADATELDLTGACSRYKSMFLQALMDKFGRLKGRIENAQNLPFKRLLDRLAEKGVSEYKVTTPPLRLTVKYKGMTMSFTCSYEGPIVQVDGFETRVRDWDEDIIELLEIIYNECQEANIIYHVEHSAKAYMANKIQDEILISTALGIIKARLSDMDYEIKDTEVKDDEVTVEIKTKTGIFYVSGSLESFAEELEDTISDMNTIDNYDFDSNI